MHMSLCTLCTVCFPVIVMFRALFVYNFIFYILVFIYVHQTLYFIEFHFICFIFLLFYNICTLQCTLLGLPTNRGHHLEVNVCSFILTSWFFTVFTKSTSFPLNSLRSLANSSCCASSELC